MIIFFISWTLIVSIIGYIVYKNSDSKLDKETKDFTYKLNKQLDELDIDDVLDKPVKPYVSETGSIVKLDDENKGELFKSFERYYLEHPNQRFWQALRNFSKYYFIYGEIEDCEGKKVEDTFYLEGR